MSCGNKDLKIFFSFLFEVIQRFQSFSSKEPLFEKDNFLSFDNDLFPNIHRFPFRIDLKLLQITMHYGLLVGCHSVPLHCWVC